MKLVLPFSEKDSALKETNSFPLAGNFFLVEKIPFAKRLGFEVLNFFFQFTTQLSLKFILLINLKLLTFANSFLLNIAGYEIFSAKKYENANIFIFISRENFMLS